MIAQESLLVTLVKLVDRIPVPPPPQRRGRGRPKVYPDRLFLKALVIMIVRHLHKVHELLSVLEQPTAEMQALRAGLTIDGRHPTRRTWERRLKAIPATLPAQIGCLGRYLPGDTHYNAPNVRRTWEPSLSTNLPCCIALSMALASFRTRKPWSS